MNKILVTGGSGFIGSHLIDKLVDLEYEVYNFDNHFPGFGNKRINPKAIELHNDVRSFEAIDFATKSVDVVIHLASLSHVSTCLKDPKLCMDINVCGTFNILEACRKNDVERVIVAATDHIYGKNPDYYPIDEKHPWKAIYEADPYGQSKAIQAGISNTYYRTYGLPVIVTASGNVFSERQSSPNVIPNFIKAALSNEDLIIHGTGKQTRDIYHIDDLINGYISCINTKGIEGELFNFGSGIETSVNDLAQKILDFIPESHSIIKHILDTKYNAMDRMSLDSSKARKRIGFKISNDIDSGLKDVISKWLKL